MVDPMDTSISFEKMVQEYLAELKSEEQTISNSDLEIIVQRYAEALKSLPSSEQKTIDVLNECFTPILPETVFAQEYEAGFIVSYSFSTR